MENHTRTCPNCGRNTLKRSGVRLPAGYDPALEEWCCKGTFDCRTVIYILEPPLRDDSETSRDGLESSLFDCTR